MLKFLRNNKLELEATVLPQVLHIYAVVVNFFPILGCHAVGLIMSLRDLVQITRGQLLPKQVVSKHRLREIHSVFAKYLG